MSAAARRFQATDPCSPQKGEPRHFDNETGPPWRSGSINGHRISRCGGRLMSYNVHELLAVTVVGGCCMSARMDSQ